MKRLLTLVAACASGWAGGCDSLPGRPSEADLPVRPSEVRDFAELFARNCAGCHGGEGRLGAARPLNDPLYLAWVDPAALRRVIRDGVPGTSMPSFARGRSGLTDAQVGVLVNGMQERWGRGGPDRSTLPPYEASAPGDPVRGAEVYDQFCARCHGTGGEGGSAGGSIVDGSYLALVSDQGLRSAVVCGRPDLGKPDYRRYVPGRAMVDQEVSDVVAWLAAQRVAFPGAPYPE